MKKIIVIVFLLFNHFLLFSQVRYEKSKTNRLSVIQYYVSDSEYLNVKFDVDG
jgi:hypothetical protein